MNIIFRFLLTGLWIFLLANILPGIHVDGFVTALIAAVILAVLNTLVKPILEALTFPVTILTLGLSLFVINVAMVYLTAYFVTGLQIDNLLSGILFAFLLSLASSGVTYNATGKKTQIS
jgi:putative membrane protein